MCVPGVGGGMPPLPGASNPAPAIGTGAAPGPAATTAPAAPAVAGAAGDGAAALAGGPSGSIAAILQQLVTTLQSVVAALGGAPTGAAAAPITGGGASGSAFDAAAARAYAVPNASGLQGQQFIDALGGVLTARQQRVTELDAALQQDSARTGTTNQLHRQQAHAERQVNETIQNLITRLTPMASSIDAAEAQLVMDAVIEMNSSARIPAAKVAKAIVQIDGTARNLPADVIASAQRLTARLQAFEEQGRAMEQQLAADSNANGGAVNQVLMQQLMDHRAQSEQLHAAFKPIFDGVADPQTSSAAIAKFDAAASKATVAEAVAALR